MLVASIVALAFLIGRESGRAERAAETGREAGTPASAPPSSPASAPLTSPSNTPAPIVSPPPAQPPVAPAPAPPSPQLALAEAGPAAERVAVERYFDEVDRLGGTGTIGGSPDALAQTLLTEGVLGNWSTFDRLIEDQRAALSALQRLSVPPACLTYHTRMGELVGEGIRLLESVKTGLTTGNVGALEAVSTEAQALQAEAGALEDLERQIRREHGLLP